MGFWERRVKKEEMIIRRGRAESNRHGGIFSPVPSRLGDIPILAGPKGFEPLAKRLRAARSDLAELRAHCAIEGAGIEPA